MSVRITVRCKAVVCDAVHTREAETESLATELIIGDGWRRFVRWWCPDHARIGEVMERGPDHGKR